MSGGCGFNGLNCCEMRETVSVVFMGGFWVHGSSTRDFPGTSLQREQIPVEIHEDLHFQN
jgi:hypothetical protein